MTGLVANTKMAMRRKPAVQNALFSDEVGKIWHESGISQPSHLAMLANRTDAEAMGLGSIADAGSVNRRAVLRRGQVSEGAPMVEFMRARRRHGVEERYPPLKGTKRTSQLFGIQNRREAFSSGQPPLTRGKISLGGG